jgi:hypothetical protein
MLVQLNGPLDNYHKRRADKHGWLYIVDGPISPYRNLIEARSLATGVVCTLLPKYVEVANALQEPEGPQLQA